MATDQHRYLSVDLGASGGTIHSGQITAETLSVTEISRFDNRPVQHENRYVWDVDRLRDEIIDGIVTCTAQQGPIDSVGIDTWGTDFGFLSDGDLLRPPYSYRDPSLRESRSDLFDKIGKKSIFDASGVAHWDAATTLYHYHWIVQNEPAVVSEADHLVMMPQLLSWMLGAEPYCEATIASTTQMMNPATKDWATDLLAAADLPSDVLLPIDSSGTTIGTVDPERLPAEVPSPEIVLPASHDTAAAVAGLPLDQHNHLFVSTGTWFITGIELDCPDQSQQAFKIGASNELGIDDTVRLLKNINGFFLLEECRRSWEQSGKETNYNVILDEVDISDSIGPLVDPDSEAFGIEGDMPMKIRRYCRNTGQEPPNGVGPTTRCVLESLTAKTAVVIEELRDVTGDDSDRIHLGGGGVRNTLFCQMLAAALDIPVVAGPVEATSIGNLLSQAWASGEITSVAEGRELISSSFDLSTYQPRSERDWNTAKERMRDLVSNNLE
jgi:rhamnulokinase